MVDSGRDLSIAPVSRVKICKQLFYERDELQLYCEGGCAGENKPYWRACGLPRRPSYACRNKSLCHSVRS